MARYELGPMTIRFTMALSYDRQRIWRTPNRFPDEPEDSSVLTENLKENWNSRALCSAVFGANHPSTEELLAYLLPVAEIWRWRGPESLRITFDGEWRRFAYGHHPGLGWFKLLDSPNIGFLLRHAEWLRHSKWLPESEFTIGRRQLGLPEVST